MTFEPNVDTEGGHIDRQRIAAGSSLIPDEYFCPICDYLLWKPRSCASCQHLFCRKCIRTWLRTNATSCPFRCTTYEERRAPPHIQSMLARLPIHCCNAPFGCTQILSYDSLEQHENIECQFLTKRCHVCEELVLVDRVEEHKMFCRPTVVQCSLCRCAVEPRLFRSHYEQCGQQRMNQLQEQTVALPNDADGTVAVPQGLVAAQNWFVALHNRTMEDALRPPTVNLRGIQRVFQARQRGLLAQIWATFILIMLNLWTAPYILLIFFLNGAIITLLMSITVPITLQLWVNASIYQAFAFIIVFSGLFSFGVPLLLRWMTDTVIIIFLSIGLVLVGSMNIYLQLDSLQMALTKTQIGFFYVAIFFIMKIVLLFVRFYFFSVSSYVTAICLAGATTFLTFHIRRFFIRA